MLALRAVLALVVIFGLGLSMQASGATAVPPAASTAGPPLATLQKQAATGDPAAEVALGHRLMQGQSRADKVAAVKWYRKAAAQGNPDGQWSLGLAYVRGFGVPHDATTGFDWMRKSLAAGPADNMMIYGMLLATYGHDPQKGFEWVHKSAEAGSVQGMIFWALLELHGDKKGIPQNKADARRWLLKAAQLGDTNAQTMMGQFDIRGKFGTPDVDAGLDWLEKAAQQGYPRAQGLLGVFLVSGEANVPKDPAAGLPWAEKAAAKHNVYGYYALGLAYQYGLGGKPVDPAKAWFNFAAAQRVDTGHSLDKVAVHLSEVGGKLSTNQLDELQAEVSKVPLPKKNHQS